MKVVLLAGGLGTRLSEFTGTVPKPMIQIGGMPIMWHIMHSYAHYGHKDFYLALGYKSELIKSYFLNYSSLNSDFTIDLSSGEIIAYENCSTDWRVTLVNTGKNSMTGGRVKRLKSYIGNEPFMLTYGDGVSDVNIDSLLEFHRSHGKMVTVTAVHPGARFGELSLDSEKVKNFQEKPQMKQGWINGGYFVVQPEFIELIEDDYTILEAGPLEKVSEIGELMAYQHEGFWQCMDTKRDRDSLEELWQSGEAKWWI